jgi:large subunit ribosomal protein L10
MSTKTERLQAIENLEKAFKDAKGIYLTDIQKVNVEAMTRLRSDFRLKGVRYVVVKNTLAKIAVERSGKNGLVPFFQGPVGVAMSASDGVVPAKIIRDFQKANKNLLAVKVAYVDGAVFSAEEAGRLAELPGREVLLSMLLGALKAPVTKFAGSLNAILSTFVRTLDAVREKKETQQK